MTTDWIEINLPFDILSLDRKYIDLPNLDKKAKVKFGKTIEEYRREIRDLDPNFDICTKLNKKLDKIEEELERQSLLPSLPSFEDSSYPEVRRQRKSLVRNKAYELNNKKFNKILKYREFSAEYDQWVESQSEWKMYLKEVEKEEQRYQQEYDKACFVGQGLNKPGILIEVELDGKLQQYLIGDINTLAGVCDDCRDFSRDTIIKRYKIVWEPTNG